MDLRNWDFESYGPINLNGEYEFYWNQLISPEDFIKNRSSWKPGFIAVPGLWNGYEYQGKKISGDGCATYRLKILLNKRDADLAVKLLEVSTSYNLFINGRKLSSVGLVGRTASLSKPGFRPEVVAFAPDSEAIDIVLQVSNFSHRLGGAWETLTLGSRGQLQKGLEKKIAYDLFLLGSILIMAFYHLGLYSLRRKDRSALFFGLFCLLISLRILTTGERYLLMFFPEIGYQIMVKLEYFTFYSAVPIFVLYFDSLFPAKFSKIIYKPSVGFGAAFSALVILFPVKVFSPTLGLYQIFTISLFLYATVLLLIASMKKDTQALIFLSGFIVLFVFSVNDILYARNIVHTGYLVQIGLFLFIFSQAYLLSRNFSKAFAMVEFQGQKLRQVNQQVIEENQERKKAEEALLNANEELEQGVYERTKELLEANNQLHLEIEERKLAQEKTKRAKMEAVTANKAKSEFLANMSHELRTPMNHIIGFTELVLDEHFGHLNEAQKEYLSDVHNSSSHLLSLINDILDLSKVEAGRLELQPSSVHLPELIEKSLTMIKEKAMKHGLKLFVHLNGIPDTITADGRKLQQIIYNLLSNAAKFTPDGGQISITAQPHSLDLKKVSGSDNKNSGAIMISVTDTGIGIRPEDYERIFLPFEQVNNSIDGVNQGTGLGLSLTRKLVELHGGRIWVESGGVNNGSTFRFVIPT